MSDYPHPVDQVLQRLLALHPKLIDLSLDRIRRLLARLDHPERRLPAVIHAAGTNGKGSTLTFLAALAASHGLRAHLYTSPHLVRFNERIALAVEPGQMPRPIPDDRLLPLLDRVEQANRGEPITFFEITTALALLAFAETPADLVLLETGLGGRVDATNVVDRPAVTVITPIGMDHMGFLGNTLALIAGEKAGIIKPGRPLVMAPQPPEAEAVIRDRAAALGAPIEPLGDPIASPPGLVGAHQRINARVAVTAFALLARQQGFSVNPAAVRQALADARWPARLQPLQPADLGLVDDQRPVWLDGAHNPEGMQVLMQAWADLVGDTPCDMIVGMMANKDLNGVMAHLQPAVAAGRLARIITVPVPDTPNGLLAADLARSLRGTLPESVVIAAAKDLAGALAMIQAGPCRPLLIAGSLYLAGSVLSRVEKTQKRLPLIGV